MHWRETELENGDQDSGVQAQNQVDIYPRCANKNGELTNLTNLKEVEYTGLSNSLDVRVEGEERVKGSS